MIRLVASSCQRLAVVLLLVAVPGSAPAETPTSRYRLTITNTSQGQNFSPPVLILHGDAYRMFELGEPASIALWRLAEDGATADFEALREPDVDRVVIAQSLHRRDAPLFSTTLEASGGRLLSIAAMLSLTNDGFVAARSVALPDAPGMTVTVALNAYDAGSEANTESCAHVPCEVHGQRMTAGAEGVVSEHPGIRGDADIPSSRGWRAHELGCVTITRLPQEDAS